MLCVSSSRCVAAIAVAIRFARQSARRGTIHDARARRDARVRAARRTADRFRRRTAGGRLPRRRSCSASARSRCPGTTDYRLPFEFTAGTRDGGSTLTLIDAASERGTRQRSATREPTCRRCRFPTTATSAARSCSPATASSCPTARISATTATPTLDVKDKIVLVLRYFPEDADPKTQRRSSPATPTCATRRWPRGSTAPRRCSSSPARVAERRRNRFR